MPVTSIGGAFRAAAGDIERQLAVGDHLDDNGLAVQPAGGRRVFGGAAVRQADAGAGSRTVLGLNERRLVDDLSTEDHLT